MYQENERIAATAKNYAGKKVVLFPSGTNRTDAVIVGVDALGWTFRVTDSALYKTGDVLFFSHACPLDFKLLD